MRGVINTPHARFCCRNTPGTERVQLLSTAVKPFQGFFRVSLHFKGWVSHLTGASQQLLAPTLECFPWNHFQHFAVSSARLPRGESGVKKQGTNIPANHKANERAAGGIQRIQPDTKQSWKPAQAASVHQEKASWELPQGFQSTLGNINCPFKQLLPRQRLQIKYYDNIL